MLGHLHADKAHDATPRLTRVRAPTLVATGENDIQVRPDYGREAASLIPGARLHLFRGPRGSHSACLEMRDEFLRETFTFVDATRA